MALPIDDLIGKVHLNWTDFESSFRQALTDAYNAGYAQGATTEREAARTRIMAAIGIAGFEASDQVGELHVDVKPANKRAPKGAVRDAIYKVLYTRQENGAPTGVIMELAKKVDPRISGFSASNELQRNKGKRYKQDDAGNWHLDDAIFVDLLDLLGKQIEEVK